MDRCRGGPSAASNPRCGRCRSSSTVLRERAATNTRREPTASKVALRTPTRAARSESCERFFVSCRCRPFGLSTRLRRILPLHECGKDERVVRHVARGGYAREISDEDSIEHIPAEREKARTPRRLQRALANEALR